VTSPNNTPAGTENYYIFDTGADDKVWEITFNSFGGFDHTSSQMYDRVGTQSSPDGLTWENNALAQTWLRTSATNSAPWSNSYGSNSAPGWILSNVDRQGSFVPDTTFTVSNRWFRVVVWSQYGTTAHWDFIIRAVST
jgi:hypothetical protein